MRGDTASSMGSPHDGYALTKVRFSSEEKGKPIQRGEDGKGRLCICACVCVRKWIGKEREENVTREQPRVSDVTAL